MVGAMPKHLEKSATARILDDVGRMAQPVVRLACTARTELERFIA